MLPLKSLQKTRSIQHLVSWHLLIFEFFHLSLFLSSCVIVPGCLSAASSTSLLYLLSEPPVFTAILFWDNCSCDLISLHLGAGATSLGIKGVHSKLFYKPA